MGMEDPLPTFTPLVERIRDTHPNFAYVHVIEDVQIINDERGTHSNNSLRKIWGDRPYIAAGGFNPSSSRMRSTSGVNVGRGSSIPMSIEEC